LDKAEIPRTEVGAIQKFKDRLRKGVLAKILQRDQWPTTIDEWQKNAQREVRRMAIVKECYASYPISSSRASFMLLTYLICMTGPSLPSTGLTSDFAAI
jgi:hypothetical protein